MSEELVSRRDLLRNVALSATLGGLNAEAAQHVHNLAVEEKQAAGGVYRPKCFQPGEFRALQALAELIVPGAGKAGAAEFIDLLSSQNEEMAAIYTGGLAWLDREMERRHGSKFAAAKPAEQTALLDLIAFRRNDSPELGPGVRFFDWARRMTVDAYYTSPAGVRELGYKGNVGMTEFRVPQQAIDHALKRSV